MEISTCGMSSSENLTYWKAPTTISNGACSLDVVPASDDICSLRLDFTSFVMTGPNTLSIAQGRRRLGQFVENHEDAFVMEGVSWTTNCLVDSFYAQGPSPSSNPPVVCGTLTGQHMYVEADVERGNRLMFHIGDVSTQLTTSRGVASVATRAWDITISHIECTSQTLPPAGCTKYFWSASGLAILTNYNWSATVATGNIHLAQQHERFCVRRERGKCVGCFAAVAAGDFAITHANEAALENFTAPNGCCGYTTRTFMTAPEVTANIAGVGHGADGNGQFGWDCIIIPGAFTLTNNADTTVDSAGQTQALMQQVIANSPTTAHMNVPQGPQICGNGAGIGPGVTKLEMSSDKTTNGGDNVILGLAVTMSVCTRSVPFILEFMSDDIEGVGNTAGDSEYTSATQAFNQGFKLALGQLDC